MNRRILKKQLKKLPLLPLNNLPSESENLKQNLQSANSELESTATMDTQAPNTGTLDQTPQPSKRSRSRQKADQSQHTHTLGGSSDIAPKGIKTPPAPVSKQLIADLTGLYASIGMFAASADPYTGVLLMMSAEKRATELVNVARHHKKMMAFLKSITTSNDYVTLAIGHGFMAYAILAHFGAVPPIPMLKQLGLSEEQVLAAPPDQGEVSQNGHATPETEAYYAQFATSGTE